MDKRKIKNKKLILSIILAILIIFTGYLYKEKYLNCLFTDPVICLLSKKYIGRTQNFSFRYPRDYPLTSKTATEMKQGGFGDKYDEYINFSSEWYYNAGGDRLGVVSVETTDFKSVQEYADKVKQDYNSLPDYTPPKIEFTKISGEDAVHIVNYQQSYQLTPGTDDYFLLNRGEIFEISFQYNSYYNKLPKSYYTRGNNIILSTFSVN